MSVRAEMVTTGRTDHEITGMGGTAQEAISRRLGCRFPGQETMRQEGDWIVWDEPIRDLDAQQIGTREVRIRYYNEGEAK